MSNSLLPQALDECSAFQVGAWRVDPRLHRMTHREGLERGLEPKVLQVLVCLAEHAGEVVTRDTLFEEAWPEVVVTDHALNRSVSVLRRELGDDPRSPEYIETIPKAGYRLIAPVEPLPEPEAVNDRNGQLSPSSEVSRAAAAPSATRSAHSHAYKHDAPVVSRAGWWGALLFVVAAVAVAAHFFSDEAPAASEGAPFTATPFTSAEGIEGKPVYSPDGTYVAFMATGSGATGFDLFVGLSEERRSSYLQLTSHPADDRDPAWTPSGKSLLFRRMTDDTCGIYEISVLGGVARRRYDCPVSTYGLALSPDGRWLALPDRATPGEPATILLIDTETGERHRLFGQHDADEVEVRPVFAPSSDRIAFVRGATWSSGDLYVASLTGGSEPRQLTTDNALISGLAWAPGGKHILFTSTRSGVPAVWSMRVADGLLTPVTNLPVHAPGNLAIHPEGEQLIVEEWRLDIDVFSSALGDSLDLAPHLNSTRSDFHATYGPDGERIAFVSSRSGSEEVWVAAADGTRPRQLTTLQGARVEWPSWSSDGQRLVFSAQRNGQSDLFTVDVDGARVQRLTATEDYDEIAPTWAAPGQVVFGTNRTGTWQLWTLSLDGGATTQVTQAGGYRAQALGDGEVLFTKHSTSGLWKLNVNTGAEEHVLTTAPAYLDGRAWDVRGDDLYYVDRARSAVCRQPLGAAASSPDCLSRPEGLEPYPDYRTSLSIAPQGDRLLLTMGQQTGTDLLIIDGPIQALLPPAPASVVAQMLQGPGRP